MVTFANGLFKSAVICIGFYCSTSLHRAGGAARESSSMKTLPKLILGKRKAGVSFWLESWVVCAALRFEAAGGLAWLDFLMWSGFGVEQSSREIILRWYKEVGSINVDSVTCKMTFSTDGHCHCSASRSDHREHLHLKGMKGRTPSHRNISFWAVLSEQADYFLHA